MNGSSYIILSLITNDFNFGNLIEFRNRLFDSKLLSLYINSYTYNSNTLISLLNISQYDYTIQVWIKIIMQLNSIT